MKLPRFLLTAGASGSGKTLITCGLLAALQHRGMHVTSFKCGPDFIDPMFHSRILGTKSRNLDSFFTNETLTRYLLRTNAAGSEIAVMEGVMGYYDGVGGTTTKASAYDLARITKTPSILIINSRGMSVSLAAYIQGFLNYRPDSNIAGVIFNQMSPMLYPRMKDLVEKELSIRVLGYVPKAEDCVIESRHLGLVLPDEIPKLKERLDRLARLLEETLDIDGILEVAQSAPPLPEEEAPEKQDPDYGYRLTQPVRIGVASDEAFCFIYEDNLRLLREMGADIVPFSPLHDSCLPKDLDGLILYGGYPELFASVLSENTSMLQSIRKALEGGLPYMAECGGFMYLHEQMEDMEGKKYPMVGVISGEAFRTPRLSRFGYITLEQEEIGCPAFGEKALGPIPAHEFHYFDSTSCGEGFRARKPESTRSWKCIHKSDRAMAGYPHLYYYGNPRVLKAFLQTCLDRKNEKSRSSVCTDV